MLRAAHGMLSCDFRLHCTESGLADRQAQAGVIQRHQLISLLNIRSLITTGDTDACNLKGSMKSIILKYDMGECSHDFYV